jgi:hypothetical protein
VQDKSDETKMISTDWRQEVIWVCGPRRETDTRESWFARGARRCGVGWRQLKALFHREVTDPKYSIGERVKSAAAQARTEALQHAEQLERMARGMECADENFYRTEVDRAFFQAHELRALAGSRDAGAG